MTDKAAQNGQDTSPEAQMVQARATIIALQQQLAAKDQEITGLKTDQILKNTYIQQLQVALQAAKSPELPLAPQEKAPAKAGGKKRTAARKPA
jgi:hypothetical protein